MRAQHNLLNSGFGLKAMDRRSLPVAWQRTERDLQDNLGNSNVYSYLAGSSGGIKKGCFSSATATQIAALPLGGLGARSRRSRQTVL